MTDVAYHNLIFDSATILSHRTLDTSLQDSLGCQESGCREPAEYEVICKDWNEKTQTYNVCEDCRDAYLTKCLLCDKGLTREHIQLYGFDDGYYYCESCLDGEDDDTEAGEKEEEDTSQNDTQDITETQQETANAQ